MNPDTVDEPLETVKNSTNETTTTVENAANETIAGDENLTSNITGQVQNATNEPAEAIETITSETVDTVEETTTEATAGVGKTVTIVATETVTEKLWRVEDTAGQPSRTLLAQSIADENPTSARSTEDRRPSGGHVIQQEIDNDAPRNTTAAVAPPAPPSETGISNSRPAMGLSAWVGVILFGGIVRHLLTTGSFLGAMPVQFGTTGGAFRRLYRLAAPLRYSKWDDSDPLDHERRQQVYETITESPGTYLSELSEELDIHRSTLRHHIKILEREQLVTRANVNGRSRIFPAFTEQKELRVALNDDATAPIVTALARLGQADCSTLASELDKDTSTLSYHLQRLEQNGVIERFRDGRSKVNRLTGDASHALTVTGTTSENGIQSSRIAD